MTAKLEQGQMTAGQPRLADGEFRQGFTFRANVVIAPRSLDQIMQSVMAQFKRTLEMNSFEQYQWPPSRVEVTPHADWQGFECELGTLAREPGMAVIQTRH